MLSSPSLGRRSSAKEEYKVLNSSISSHSENMIFEMSPLRLLRTAIIMTLLFWDSKFQDWQRRDLQFSTLILCDIFIFCFLKLNSYAWIPGTTDVEYEGWVYKAEKDHVLLLFFPGFQSLFPPNTKFNVRFTFNRMTMRLMHRLDYLESYIWFFQSSWHRKYWPCVAYDKELWTTECDST